RPGPPRRGRARRRFRRRGDGRAGGARDVVPRQSARTASPALIEAELVPLRIGHDDEPAAQGWLGFKAFEPARAEINEAAALGFEGLHPLFTLQARYGPQVEVEPVLHRLLLRHALEVDPRPVSLRILDRRGDVVLVLRNPDLREIAVPGVERALGGEQVLPGR